MTWTGPDGVEYIDKDAFYEAQAAKEAGPGHRIERIDPERLSQIWLDGFTSGAASLAKGLGCTDETADKLADEIATALMGDPACMETVRREVFERLMGLDDTGPKNMTAFKASEC